MFIFLEELKETVLDLLQVTVRVFFKKISWICCSLRWYQYKMTQYINVSVKLADSQLEKLKSATKNRTGETLNQ